MKVINPYKQHLKTGHFSWVLDSYSHSKKKHTISIQWLRWQGGEFSIACDSKADRDSKIKKLREVFAPKHKPYLIDANLTCSRWSLSFDITNKTLMPRDILNVLGKDIVIELTPKSINSRKLLKGI